MRRRPIIVKELETKLTAGITVKEDYVKNVIQKNGLQYFTSMISQDKVAGGNLTYDLSLKGRML